MVPCSTFFFMPCFSPLCFVPRQNNALMVHDQGNNQRESRMRKKKWQFDGKADFNNANEMKETEKR